MTRHIVLSVRRPADDPDAETHGPAIFWVCRWNVEDDAWDKLRAFDTPPEAEAYAATLNGKP